MEPITIITIITAVIGALIAGIPIIYVYSQKLAKALTYIQLILTAINTIMKGNLDGHFTDEEKIAAFDAIYPIALKIDQDTNVSAFFK